MVEATGHDVPQDVPARPKEGPDIEFQTAISISEMFRNGVCCFERRLSASVAGRVSTVAGRSSQAGRARALATIVHCEAVLRREKRF
jgi:hypothetical protein